MPVRSVVVIVVYRALIVVEVMGLAVCQKKRIKAKHALTSGVAVGLLVGFCVTPRG